MRLLADLAGEASGFTRSTGLDARARPGLHCSLEPCAHAAANSAWLPNLKCHIWKPAL